MTMTTAFNRYHRRNEMRFIFRAFLSVVLIGAWAARGNATPADAGRVPADWISLPEETGAQLFHQPSNLEDERAHLDKSLRRIFLSQGDALLAAKQPTVRVPSPAKKPSDWVPWRLKAVSTDLAVSASGLIGVLGFKGTPSVSVYWAKRESHSHLSNLDDDPEFPVFRFNETPGPRGKKAQLEVIHRTVLASGRVKNTKELRGNLERAVNQFQDLSVAAKSASADGAWYLGFLRMDLEISASGRVKWGSVGGAVKIRLEWHHAQATAGTPSAPRAPEVPVKFNPTQKNLRALVGSLCEDLASASNNPMVANYQARMFVVGLGIGASGNVGVAKASASAIGYMHFFYSPTSRRPSRFIGDDTERPSKDPFYLIDHDPSAETLRFAKSNGIETVPSNQFVEGGATAFKLDRQAFRIGLRKAFQIGKYFAEQADKTKNDEWAINIIRPAFALSVSGDVGLAKLTGQVSALIQFNNLAF